MLKHDEIKKGMITMYISRMFFSADNENVYDSMVYIERHY